MAQDGMDQDRGESARETQGAEAFGQSDLQQAREAARRLAAFSESLIRNANVLVVGLDLKGHVTLFNEMAEQTTGYSRDEVVGRPWFETVCPRDRFPQVWAIFETFVASGAGIPRDFENPILTKDGRERYIMWRNSEITPEGGALGTVSFGLDITERRLVEQAVQMDRETLRARGHDLEAANRHLAEAKLAAEQASRAKSRFLANVGHELRTPLNSIIGFSEMLLEQPWSEIQADAPAYIGKILGSSRDLLNLINKILDLSKIEAGMLKVVREPFDVRRAVQETADAALKAAQRNGNTIEVSLPAQLPPVDADVTRVKQVLSYLLGNAVKFTRGGTIQVRVMPVCERGSNWMRFEVRDTGIGIPPDVARNLFEDFMQVDASDTRKYDGTGLGLALGRRLARLMGGDITLDSTPGKGTVAALLLPIASRRDTAAGLTEGTIPPDSWSI